MSYLHYFAYGSNMSEERLRARVPSAKSIGVYRLDGYQLVFHKRGRDGSAKCDALHTGVEDVMFGVVYSMLERERPELDRVEGLGRGYDSCWVDVAHEDGHRLQAYTYTALDTGHGLAPFDWYHEHVVRGAVAAGLPAAYVERLQGVATVVDPDAARQRRELSIYEICMG